MATTTTTTTALMVSMLLLSMLLHAALSQEEGPASAPAPAMVPYTPDCTSALVNMSSCLTYVEAGSKTKSPEKGCCPGLADIVNNSPVCLCELLGGGASAYGLQIDTARAMALPAVCKVDTLPVSLCSVFGIPIASPSPYSPLTASPVSGGPAALAGSPMGLGTPDASPPSTNRGSRSFSAIDLATLVGVLYAGIIVIMFF